MLNIPPQGKQTHILVNGFFWSGSSAVVDFLTDYTCVGRVPHEFNDFRRLGWVGDLLAANADASLHKGFHEFILANKPDSQKNFDVAKQKAWQLLFPKKGNLSQVVKKRYMALFDLVEQLENTDRSVQQKIVLAKEWLATIGNIYAPSSDFVVFDQPLRICQHAGIWEPVFDPYKLILVYRDPRDQFADIIQRGKLYDDFAGAEDLAELYGRTREGAINYHVSLLNKKLRFAMEYTLQHPNTLLFSFETFLKKHEQLAPKLLDRLGIKNMIKHSSPRFQPAMSSKNVGIYQGTLSNKDLRQLEEVMAVYRTLEQHNTFYN